MTREEAAELRVQNALEKIEAAQNLLHGAAAELSSIIGAMKPWERVGKLGDKAHDEWRRLAYHTRQGWKLDHEPNPETGR